MICWRDVIYEKAAFGWIPRTMQGVFHRYCYCYARSDEWEKCVAFFCTLNSRLCKQDMTCLHYPVRKSRFRDCQSPSPSSLGWASVHSKCCIIPCLPIARDVLPRDANRKGVEKMFLCSPQCYHRYLQPCHYHLPAHFYNTATSRYDAATREMLTRPFARKYTISPSNTSTPTAPTRGYSSQVQNTESTSPADKYAH